MKTTGGATNLALGVLLGLSMSAHAQKFSADELSGRTADGKRAASAESKTSRGK